MSLLVEDRRIHHHKTTSCSHCSCWFITTVSACFSNGDSEIWFRFSRRNMRSENLSWQDQYHFSMWYLSVSAVPWPAFNWSKWSDERKQFSAQHLCLLASKDWHPVPMSMSVHFFFICFEFEFFIHVSTFCVSQFFPVYLFIRFSSPVI